MHKSKQLGHDPQVIAAGRRVNDYIPHFIAKKVVTTLIDQGKNPGDSKVLVMGVTFKENVADIRNSKVFDLIKELRDYSLDVDVVDPYASAKEVKHEYGIDLTPSPIKGKYDVIIIAVGHDVYKNQSRDDLKALVKKEINLFDIKGIRIKSEASQYWKL